MWKAVNGRLKMLIPKKKIWKVIHVALKVTSIFLRLKTQKQINWCDGLWASDLLCSSLQAIWEWLIGRDGQNLSWWQCRAESRLSLSLLHEALVCLCAAVDSSSFCFCLAFYFDSLTHCWWADKHIVVIFFNLIKHVFLIKVMCGLHVLSYIRARFFFFFLWQNGGSSRNV